MPLDIRHFFAKKPAGGSANSNSNTNSNSNSGNGNGKKKAMVEPQAVTSSKKAKMAPTEAKPKATKTTSKTITTTKVASSSSKNGQRPKETSKKVYKGVDTSSEEEEDKVTAAVRKQSPKKRLKTENTMTSTTETIGGTRTSPRSRTRTATPQKLSQSDDDEDDDDDDDDVQAMSASEYFSKTAPTKNNNKKQPSQKSWETPPPSKAASTGRSSNSKTNSSSKRKRERVQDDSEHDDDDDDDDFRNVASDEGKDQDKKTTPAKRTSPTRTATPAASKTKRAATSTSPLPKTVPKPPPVPILEPILDEDSFDVRSDAVVPECLQGLTFVLTGILTDLSRDDASDLIKTLGGRVTTGVSGKTSFVVVGEVLEDGRPVEQGKKYISALERKIPMIKGVNKLYGLCHLYQNLAKQRAGICERHQTESTKAMATATKNSPSTAPLSAAATKAAVAGVVTTPTGATPKANPYAKKVTVNPYAQRTGATAPRAEASNLHAAQKTNPYSKAAAPVVASTAGPSTISVATTATKNTVNQLWVDRHAPQSTRDILGNKDNVTKLATWLNNWEITFNNPKAYNKAFSNPKGPWKAALLSGPPGIGKTTTATLVAKEAGRDLREFNASDARSKKALQQQLGDLTGSHTLGFKNKTDTKPQGRNKKQLRCIIMDEVDGMGAGDRSGMAELIQMIKKSKVPIICICNDRQSQKMKSLLPYCMDLRFKRPVKSVMANRAIRIAQMEGLHVERNAAEAIAESCGNDVRQVLNVLQMWAQNKTKDLTFQSLKDREKSINKDEILRVSLFDAARLIMEGRKGLSGADGRTQRDSLFRRADAFFVDYSFTGLLVQQNYPKVMQQHYSLVKKADNAAAELKFLDRMYEAAASMSDYAMVEHEIRSGDQNWSLLPTCAMMTVKTGYHAGGKTGGSLSGYPEFTAWMGKNSTKGKKQRILSELHHHMNFKISADSQQLRESYLPVFRDRFLTLFTEDSNDAALDAAIQLMDEYGLSREDVMDKLDEFELAKKGEVARFADLDSKQKAAFTRRYNQISHKSQALVQEEFSTTKPKKGGGKREKDPLDLDAIDEDIVEDDESDGDDEESELRKLREKLAKGKGRKGAASKAAETKKPAASKKGRKKL